MPAKFALTIGNQFYSLNLMKKTIKLFIAFIFLTFAINAQEKLPVIKSNVDLISIQNGSELIKNAWRLSPEAKPDIYEADLIDGKTTKVTFITDVDSISFNVEEGKKYNFIIQKGEQICYTQIVGKRFVPAANFDAEYQKKFRGKTTIEIPEVYELVNIAIALTPTGINEKGLVVQDTEYYKAVRQWFDEYKDYKVIRDFEEQLKKNPIAYYNLKMNGYSYEFNSKNKLVKSKIYDRTGFASDKSNKLEPFISQLEVFAIASNFRKFYKKHKKFYADQIAFYHDTANIAEMKNWLDKNFPSSNDYDSYKIVFSPLVGSNQSTTWFESNGFKELQPHVNFPYRFNKELSEKSQILQRGAIVFTEINHGYINPEAEKYADQVIKATSNRYHWVSSEMGDDYYPGIDAFEEYMNWALVSLRYVDYAPENEQEKLISSVDEMMTKRRGFPQFAEFDKFIVELYKNRQSNQTLADLYPQIIEWFEKNNG